MLSNYKKNNELTLLIQFFIQTPFTLKLTDEFTKNKLYTDLHRFAC